MDRVDIRDVGMNWEEIFSHVVIDEVSELRIDNRFFHQGRTDAEYHGTDRLVACKFGIENASGGKHTEHPTNTYLSGVYMNRSLGEDGAESSLCVSAMQIRSFERSDNSYSAITC